MKLLIMRHGAAEQHASSDAARALTHSGWQQSVAMARWLQTQPIVVEQVVASPTRRTQQTFEALRSVMPQLTQLPQSLDLTPQGKVAPIIEQLQQDDALQLPVLLIISHMPLVSQLVSALCPVPCAHTLQRLSFQRQPWWRLSSQESLSEQCYNGSRTPRAE